MGMIRQNIIIKGVHKRKKISALFDSGASHNCIRRQFSDGENVDDIGFHIYEGDCVLIIASEESIPGQIVRFRKIQIMHCNEIEPEFIITDKLSEDVIIGAQLMQKLGIILDMPNEKIKFRI